MSPLTSSTSTPSPRAIAARIRCSMVCVLPAPTLPQISQCRVSRSRLTGRPGKNSNAGPESRLSDLRCLLESAPCGRAREQLPAAQDPSRRTVQAERQREAEGRNQGEGAGNQQAPIAQIEAGQRLGLHQGGRALMPVPLAAAVADGCKRPGPHAGTHIGGVETPCHAIRELA